MPDQAAILALVPPPAVADCTGPALDKDAGGRVIPLDSRRRRLSPGVVDAARACHPAQLWADRRAASPS
jgi:hypothetical protein